MSDVTITAIFRAIVSSGVWQSRLDETVKLYAAHNSLAHLGDAMVRHLSKLTESLLSSEGLEQWARQWETAAADYPAMRLPLRLLRGGIAYLKTKPGDEGVLLQLPMEERQILRQALGLAPEQQE